MTNQGPGEEEDTDTGTSSMNVSFKWSEAKVDELDEAIFQAKVEGDIPKKTNRSDVIRSLLDEYIKRYTEGNTNQRMVTENLTN